MDGMRDSLMCPIHLDLLENAKTLPCQHVVCEECIGLWVAKKGELMCPTCKKRHSLPAGGVASLPTNFMINGLVDEFKKMGKEGKKGRSGRKKSDCDGLKDGRPKPQKPRVDPRKSFLEKSSKIYEDVCGSTISLVVQLCNSEGQHLHNCDAGNRLNASVFTPKGKKIGASTNYQRKDGQFLLSFVPKICGVYRVEALLGNDNVNWSPLMVVVHPEGKFLAGIRGEWKCPIDVAVVGSSLCVADYKAGPYSCTDWLGRQLVKVDNPEGKKVEDINAIGILQIGEKLYITDNVHNCVYIYTNGSFVSSFGKKVLEHPMGITSDRNDLIYIANRESNNISVFAPNLSFLKNVNVGGGRKFPNSPYLTCLAINQAEDLLVVGDHGNNCLKVVNIESSKVVNTITTKFGQALATPWGVAIDKDDNIYTTVVYNAAEQKRPGGPKGGSIPHKEQKRGGKSHTNAYGGWSKGQGSSSADGEELKGAVLMYNSEGYFLGRFGGTELFNPGGICILEEPSVTAIVVDKEGTGYGSTGPSLKVFSV